MPYCAPCDRYFGSRHALQQHLDNSTNHNSYSDDDDDYEIHEWAMGYQQQSPSDHSQDSDEEEDWSKWCVDCQVVS